MNEREEIHFGCCGNASRTVTAMAAGHGTADLRCTFRPFTHSFSPRFSVAGRNKDWLAKTTPFRLAACTHAGRSTFRLKDGFCKGHGTRGTPARPLSTNIFAALRASPARDHSPSQENNEMPGDLQPQNLRDPALL